MNLHDLLAGRPSGEHLIPTETYVRCMRLGYYTVFDGPVAIVLELQDGRTANQTLIDSWWEHDTWKLPDLELTFRETRRYDCDVREYAIYDDSWELLLTRPLSQGTLRRRKNVLPVTWGPGVLTVRQPVLPDAR